LGSGSREWGAMRSVVFAGLTLLLCLALVACAEEKSEDECAAAGFQKGVVSCATCTTVESVIGDAAASECRGCCQGGEEAQSVAEKFENVARAVLVMCQWKAPRYPMITAFLDGSAEEYRVTKLNVWGAYPALRLYDDQDNLVGSIRIDSWKTEDIEEFLEGVGIARS